MSEASSSAPPTVSSRGTAIPVRRGRGSDGVTVGLFSVAAFLLVLALLGTQLGRARAPRSARPTIVVRRIDRTTVIESVLPAASAGAPGTTSVVQSVSGSPAPAIPAAPLITKPS